MKIGPRKLYILGPENADEEPVEFSITSEFTYGQRVEDDPSGYTGHALVVGNGWRETIKVFAVDEIQLVGRLVRVVGSALLGACERDGRELRSFDRIEPITDPMQII